MTEDADFKRLVRERMARTGETYTAARAALRPDPAPTHRWAHIDPDHTTVFEADDEIAQASTGAAEVKGRTSMTAYLEVDPTLTVDHLITLGSLGVTPEGLGEIRAAWPGCGFEDVVALHTMGVSSDTLATWQDIDPDLDLADVLGAATVGLTPETFRSYRERFGDLTVDQALTLHTVGVTP